MMTKYHCFLTTLLLLSCTVFAGCSEAKKAEPERQVRSSGQMLEPLPAPRSPRGLSVNEMAIALAPETALPVGPGERTPPLRVKSFVHGESIEKLDKGKIYVVEFWATWCGPCLQSLPLMARLQSQYQNEITVIGVTSEEAETVEGFLKRPVEGEDEEQTWADVINYSLAIDDQDRTHREWREASHKEGLPYAIVVGKTGLVEWMGHPASIEGPLQKIVEGTWDYTAAREKMIAEARGQEAIDRQQQAIVTAVNAGNYNEALQITNRILKRLPGNPKVLSLRRQLALEGKLYGRLNQILADQVRVAGENPEALNNIAWEVVTEMDYPERNLDLALEAALRASELTEHRSSSILDTVARVYREQGNLAEAVAWQQKAVDAEPQTAYFQQVLKEYQTLLDEQTESTGNE